MHELNKNAWRAEACLHTPFKSSLLIPTEEGLACIQADIASLSYVVTYIGKGMSLASPAKWLDNLWAPIERNGQLHIVRTNNFANSEQLLSVENEGVSDIRTLSGFQAPIASARNLVWMCDQGRLQLTRKPSGEVIAHFLPWPGGLLPQFDFGAPYQAKNGDLWQLCQSVTDQTYTYLNLSSRHHEQEVAEQPRPCTGQFNYRFAQRVHTPPWTEPEHGHDGAQTSIVLPQLESTADNANVNNNAVLGLRLEKSPQGVANMLRTKDRLRAILICETTSQKAFGQIAVAAPWNLRWFVHDNKLWAFHPELRGIYGWDLES